ncbi:MAG: ABC transporter substrate-binding protein [Bacillota bacterium]
MDQQSINVKDTLFEITEKYQGALELLVSAGFENMRDEEQRKTFGKSISLEMALKLKKINVDTFKEQLLTVINDQQSLTGQSLQTKQSLKNPLLRVAGVLPCPVKTPLMEALENWLRKNNLGERVDYDLRAASMGVDWIKETLKRGSADEVADIFISAGFDLFFDKDFFGRYKDTGLFADISGVLHYNRDFENDYISLKDPDNQYSMLAVVPAIFLVNTEELEGRKMPSCWEDILRSEFEQKVSLPVEDFDLFNAMLLNIYKSYGEEGVAKLGKSLLKSMHPSQMVKSHIRKEEKPIVTIMPYFFTKMLFVEGPMVPVWPRDGAIISPIFMLTKQEKREQLKPFVDFLISDKVGEILSHNGRFPSVNPNVDNRVPREQKYIWLGWDFIKENDIGALIKSCEKIFYQAASGV